MSATISITPALDLGASAQALVELFKTVMKAGETAEALVASLETAETDEGLPARLGFAVIGELRSLAGTFDDGSDALEALGYYLKDARDLADLIDLATAEREAS